MLDEVERLAVEQHVLLLDAERVRRRPCRTCGRGRCRPAAKPLPLPVIAGGIDLLASRDDRLRPRSRRASAGRAARRRRRVHAGRTSPKTSPCARPTSSKCRGVGDVDPRADDVAAARARPRRARRAMISRQRCAWPYGVGGRVGVVRHDRRRARDVDVVARRGRRASSPTRSGGRPRPLRTSAPSTLLVSRAVEALRQDRRRGRAHAAAGVVRATARSATHGAARRRRFAGRR